jgi:purine nucleosidase
MRIWIDTDIGSDVDDALALAYVLRHPELELAGVSTVFGDTPLRSRIASELLQRAGAAPVPVVTGLGLPLSPGKQGHMFGHEGIGLFDDPSPRMVTSEEPERALRVADMKRAIEGAQPDALLAIGPLSNLGALLDAGARLPRLFIMGGKVAPGRLQGAVGGIFEWNWFCDPVAVQRVLVAPHASLPRVVPAEVTFRTRLEDGDVDRLGEAGPLGESLAVSCREWLRAQVERLGSKRALVALHDPLTAATMVHDGLCPFRACRIEIDDKGETREVEGAANVEVATDVDEAGTREHLMTTWLGGSDGG